MKLIITSALAVTLSTAAFAGNSDRYNDLRFDSAVGHIGSFANAPDATANNTVTFEQVRSPKFSSRNARAPLTRGHKPARGERFPYGGWGKGNDSR